MLRLAHGAAPARCADCSGLNTGRGFVSPCPHPAKSACSPSTAVTQALQQPSRTGRACAAAAAAAAAAAPPPVSPPATTTSSSAAPPLHSPPTPASPDPASDGAPAASSERYTADMQAKMGTSLTYTHEAGMNYNRVLPDLIVGSCLQTPEDLDWLRDHEDVRTVFNLQEDCDMEYFSLDVAPIRSRAAERGVEHVRFPIRDFDPYDLRRRLPKAVARLARAHNPAGGTVYIHCTAGLGRAPATALAYMCWVRGWQLDEAFAHLRAARTCSPKLEAVRSATIDLLLGTTPVPATITLYRRGLGKDFKVAGGDWGWHQLLPMTPDPRTGNMVLTRSLSPGAYPFKFVVDGVWSISADYPTVQDGGNVNNVLTVVGRDTSLETSLRLQRLLTVGADLTREEREELRALLCPWGTHPAAATPVLADVAGCEAGGAEPPAELQAV